MSTNKVSVLLLIFNRSDNALKVLEQIKLYHPTTLYIAADGPRKHKKDEAEICDNVRKTICNAINWPCEVRTLFQTENLGCAKAVNNAISWFFTQEEYGIIIEDDIILSPDFFQLCEILLPKYKEDERIMQISAQNRSQKFHTSNEYIFNVMPVIWGWATWRRAWRKMDMQMNAWPNFSKIRIIKTYGLFQGCMMWYYWHYTYKHIETTQSWATRWFFAILANNGMCICPKVNLAINSGIGTTDATHYKKGDKDPYAYLKLGKINWPLKIDCPVKLNKRQLFYDRQDFFRIRMIGINKRIRKLLNFQNKISSIK